MSERSQTKAFRDGLTVRRALHLVTKARGQLEYADDALLAAGGEFFPQSSWIESVINDMDRLVDGLALVSHEYPL